MNSLAAFLENDSFANTTVGLYTLLKQNPTIKFSATGKCNITFPRTNLTTSLNDIVAVWEIVYRTDIRSLTKRCSNPRYACRPLVGMTPRTFNATVRANNASRGVHHRIFKLFGLINDEMKKCSRSQTIAVHLHRAYSVLTNATAMPVTLTRRVEEMKKLRQRDAKMLATIVQHWTKGTTPSAAAKSTLGAIFSTFKEIIAPGEPLHDIPLIDEGMASQRSRTPLQRLPAPTTARSFYNILGVQKTASSKQIRQAYRRLALAEHPDKHGAFNKRKQTEKFINITNAYHVLVNPQRRAAYDSKHPDTK